MFHVVTLAVLALAQSHTLPASQLSIVSGGVVAPQTPALLSTYTDPDPAAYVGWGYPSVFPTPGGFRCLYQGFFTTARGFDKYLLGADSPDGVHWAPLNNTGHAGWPSNAVAHLGSEEAGVVFDDPLAAVPSQRLKVLLTNTTVWASPDGLAFAPLLGPSGQPVVWERTPMDPGFGVLRAADGQLVVTSRPPSLRAAGRHAGIHNASTWAALGGGDAHRNLPIDTLYSKKAQLYGLPVFAPPGDTYTGFLWVYDCQPASGTCYHGGTMKALLAQSSNALNWTVVSQVPFLAPTPNTPYSQQVYPNTLLPVNGSFLVHASAATVPHGSTPPNSSAILTFAYHGHGMVAVVPSPAAAEAVVRTPHLSSVDLASLTVNAACGPGAHLAARVVNGTDGAVTLRGDALAWSPALEARGGGVVEFTLVGDCKLFSVSSATLRH